MFFAASDTDAILAFFARFDESFFHYCDKELCKINTFFSGNELLNRYVLFLHISCTFVVQIWFVLNVYVSSLVSVTRGLLLSLFIETFIIS